ncbi:MAG TPA: ATP-binding protein [Steroidobacteraceae bacterium]|nr:ATP-binding protein [Steroidobacteraceae bacterium]
MLRYVAAIAVVLVTVTVRAAMSPLLGTQAPLLPFVLAVFASAYLGGGGPGLLASFLTPIAATIWFTTWPHDASPGQWAAHVAFFLLVAALATALMRELQRSAEAQVAALRAADRSARSAEDSAAQLRLIADSVPVLISYIGKDGFYRFVNRQYHAWFGGPPDAMVGKHISEMVGVAAFEVLRPRIERALNGERVFFEHELPFTGGPREVAVHYIPDFDGYGRVRGCFALIEDVGPRKRAERILRETDRRKDEFLAMLAHELRNPLTPIRNVAHILAKGNPEPATVRRTGEMLERQANQLTRLVSDLLDVARIIRGRVTLERTPLDIGRVLDTALEAVRPQTDLRGQTVTTTRPIAPLFVEGDAVRLCQVISNLLTNASKYSPEGARIDVSLGESAGDVQLVVRDEGIGIDPQMMPRLFDEGFLQGDRTLDRTHDGLGVGLTIVKHVVELHGGEVDVQSAGLGKGSEFSIRLRRVAAPPQLQPDGGEPLQRAPRRVLVVEDSRDSAESLRELLRMSGHEVMAVHDGAQALSVLEDFRADVVLLDVALPRMDGFMVAHAIRARFAHLPLRPRLLALTGHGREEDRLSALRSGFDGHLTKPVEPAVLLQAIAQEGPSQVMPSELGRESD